MGAALVFLNTIITLAPTLLQLGQDVTPLLQRLASSMTTSTDPTDADWEALRAMEAPIRADLQTPITDEALASL